MVKVRKTLAFTLVFCSVFLVNSFTGFAAPEQMELTPKQKVEVELAKKRTEHALAHPTKQVDHSQAKEVAKVKGIPVEKLDVNIASVGTYGDILVTLTGKGSSSSAWAGGHAGIVRENSAYTVESFGNQGDLNGVRQWPNDWETRYPDVKGLRVYNASLSDYQYVASYAGSQIGKPYNYNFFYISTTNSFYCSQLVWRAWYNLGYDLNDGGAVWPVDLYESPLTYLFYSKG